MTRPIDELLRQTGVPVFDPDDATLSGGEVAIARIVSVLRADWDRLDSQQQRVLITALEASTQATEEAEAFVLNQLKSTK
ncbi:antitoxin [Corynebacterium stationis]|uniref:antitoxin n=1 Tax=Corynebacterium stationis TaxID=1705 RepID=UPI0028ADA0B4|nr:antitoxin [Corynebacterium stationis]